MPSLVESLRKDTDRWLAATLRRSSESAFFFSSAEILQANDLLTQGVLLYKQVVEGRVNAGNAVPAAVGAIPAPRGVC